MEKRTLRLYGFKLKNSSIVDLFNDTDLIGYEKNENGAWVENGFSWIVNNPTYIIDSFYDYYKSESWIPITETEFKEIVKDNLKGFDCQLIDSDYPIEKLFNKTVVYADINTIEDLDNFADNATFTQMSSITDYDEPMYYTKSETVSEIEDNNNIGKYRIIY